MTPIVPNLAESASRSRSEAGFPLRAGNNCVLIISSSGCSSGPMFGGSGYVGPFAYHSVSERGIDRVGVGVFATVDSFRNSSDQVYTLLLTNDSLNS